VSTTASVSAATTPRSSSNVTSRLLIFAGLLATSAFAEITPLDTSLPDDKETTITCELTVAPKVGDVPVLDTAKQCEATKGTYHYKLYIPADYSRDPQRRYPCLFIMSASGNAGMWELAPWLKAHRYVVVSLVEAQNGPWAPIVGNFLAAHDDVVKRVRIQEGLKVATGVSGGARASSVFVQSRPGFGGLVMQAAGASYNNTSYNVAGIKRNPALSCVITMGNQDSNKGEVARMKTALSGQKLLCLSFEGGHTAAPVSLFEQAMQWIESNVDAKIRPLPALKPVVK